MAINDYSTLQTAIINWIDRSDISDRVPEFISLAEARINRKLRVRGIADRSTTLLVSGQQYYTLPTDFLQTRNVQITTNPIKTLVYRTPEQIDVEYPSTSSGTPVAFTIIGDEIQLRPVPSSTDTLEIAYFARPAALSDSNTTNWVITNAPDLLLYGSLIEAEGFLVNDERIGIWKSLYENAMRELNTQEFNGRYSGSHLEVRT